MHPIEAFNPSAEAGGSKKVPKPGSITCLKTNKAAAEKAPIVCESTTGQQNFVSAPSASLKHAGRPQQKASRHNMERSFPKIWRCCDCVFFFFFFSYLTIR